MTYTVTSRREVPVSDSHRCILTGRQFIEDNIHGGSKAVHVRLDSGYNAWGFGADFGSAEANAVANASVIADAMRSTTSQ